MQVTLRRPLSAIADYTPPNRYLSTYSLDNMSPCIPVSLSQPFTLALYCATHLVDRILDITDQQLAPGCPPIANPLPQVYLDMSMPKCDDRQSL